MQHACCMIAFYRFVPAMLTNTDGKIRQSSAKKVILGRCRSLNEPSGEYKQMLSEDKIAEQVELLPDGIVIGAGWFGEQL